MTAFDQECVERVLAGEPRFFEELVRRYTRFGGAIAYGVVGDFQQAEDVLQEAFFKAFRALPTLRQPERFKVWFAGIVRSHALDALRKRRSRGRREVGLYDFGDVVTSAVVSPEISPDERQTLREEREQILKSISELPEDDRLMIVLKHLEGLSYKEIAQVTTTTVSAVESRLFRARRALKEKLPRK